MSIAISSPSENTGKIQVNGTDRLLINSDQTLQAVVSPAQFDSSKKIATTEFVKNALGSYSGIFTTIVTDTTLTAAQIGKTIFLNASDITVTLPGVDDKIPSGATLTFNTNGRQNVTLVGKNGELITKLGNTNGGGLVSSIVLSGDNTLELIWVYNNWYVNGGSQALANSGLFAASKATSGYQKLPSDVIIQWGIATSSGSADTTVTFPIAFPTAVPLITGSVGATLASLVFVVNTASKTSFTCNVYNTTNARSVNTFSWVAIGY